MEGHTHVRLDQCFSIVAKALVERQSRIRRKWFQLSLYLLNPERLKRFRRKWFQLSLYLVNPERLIVHKKTMLKKWRSICSNWVRHEFTYGQGACEATSHRVACILPVYVNSIKPEVEDSDTDDVECLPDVDVDGWIWGKD